MKNRLQELLAAGDTAIGAMIQLPSALVVEVLAQPSFDRRVIDTEHGSIDESSASLLTRSIDTSRRASRPFSPASMSRFSLQTPAAC